MPTRSFDLDFDRDFDFEFDNEPLSRSVLKIFGLRGGGDNTFFDELAPYFCRGGQLERGLGGEKLVLEPWYSVIGVLFIGTGGCLGIVCPFPF